MIRLPWGRLSDILSTFARDHAISMLGALSFEERCCSTPRMLTNYGARSILLVRVEDPRGSFPDYSATIKRRIDSRRRQLNSAGVKFEERIMPLLAGEDELLELQRYLEERLTGEIVVLDITSLPKRYFAFLTKRLLSSHRVSKLIATYTESGRGYTVEHLASDPLPCDHLPGFAARLDHPNGTLIVSVGYESLGIQSILDVYHDRRRDTRFILPFPPGFEGIRRQWNTLWEFVGWESQNLRRESVEVLAAWDTELAYRVIEMWGDGLGPLTLAPFGAKPHSLAMALYAIHKDYGLFYSQPRSYHPDYSLGCGETWAYVIKWDGVPCFERRVISV